MYLPKGGETYTVMAGTELAIDVYLPPLGYGWNHDLKRVEKVDLISRSSIKEDQHWECPRIPQDYSKKTAREKRFQKSDPNYIDQELQEYRSREWHRRLFGVWFLNNGNYIYIPGDYYFYLSHWKLDVGAPKYKRADLEKAYFWNYCCEDPACYGMVESTKRRIGKSFWAACMLYEYASRSSNAHSGIQSKTRPDGGLVFSEKLIQPWRKLIDFFKPRYDTSKGSVPKSELRFFETSKKGKSIDEGDYDAMKELESWIDFESSGELAYDGQKLLRYLCDEIFKTTEANILKRHDVVKPCLENEDGDIIGKAIYTSTVEDMEGHIERYLELWNNSDITKRNENGRTLSGLYRFFTAAQKIMYVDKYGEPDEERALQKIQNEIDAMTDPRAISDYLRKNPRNWKEAFRTTGEDCIYDPMKIDDRLSILNFLDSSDLYTRGNLIWDDDTETTEIPRVRFAPNTQGRFYWSKKFDFNGYENDVLRRGTSFLPKNIANFIVGIDPYDHSRTRSGRFSNGAAAVYMKYDPLQPDTSDNFVIIYIGRPKKVQIFYEDMVKLCHILSCQMLFEDNKPGIQYYFNERGYNAFMVKDEKGFVGIPATDKSHQALAENTEAFIDENCHRTQFPQLLNDWKSFDLDNTEEFDMGMASGWALVGASRMKKKLAIGKKAGTFNKSQFVRKYRLKGRSRLNKKRHGKFSVARH